ncbi:MAG: lipid A deacylase LpxR family protein [Thermodesulfobacteriota bacterium]
MSSANARTATLLALLALAALLPVRPAAAAAAFVLPPDAAAAAPEGGNATAHLHPAERRTFIAYFENDLFADADEHYTNAVKFTYLTKDLDHYRDSWLPEWAVGLLEAIPKLGNPGDIHNVGFSLGQDIYTPEDTQATELQAQDRPYAGWLYFSVALHAKNASRLDTFELTGGMAGPSALGEQSQNTVHRVRNIPTAKGWEHQLHDEPGAMATWLRTWRFEPGTLGPWGLEWDRLAHAGATAGNVFTFANAGGEVRLGHNLPHDFGTNMIRPGGASAPPAVPGDPWVLGEFGWHLFLGADARGVAHNIFLDGNTWGDSHRATRLPLVADVYTGAALLWDRYKLTYTHCWRTDEYKGQHGGQFFGSLALAVSF